MLRKLLLVAVVSIVLAGCSSTQRIGMLSLPTESSRDIITEARTFTELGPVEGRSCRYFLLALVPWGNSTPGRALEKALSPVNGDAIIDASVATSLFGFIPVYNIFSYTCTTVSGIAIRYDEI